MDTRELLSGLGVMEIARSCAVSLDTARRWKRRGRLPEGMHRLLELTALGELGAIARAFAGWRLDARAGELVSPEAWRFAPGEIRAIPFRHGQIRILEGQVRELVSAIEGRADRRARVEALAIAAAGLQLLERALEQLVDELTTRERDRLFELRAQKSRDAGEPGAATSTRDAF